MADSVLPRASNLSRDLVPAPLGLGYAAKQWLCSNYYIGYKHKGDPESICMYVQCVYEGRRAAVRLLEVP